MDRKYSKWVHKGILYYFLILGFSPITAQEPTEEYLDISFQDSFLSVLYERGPILIYDCISDHWVCTGPIEKGRCDKDRKEALLDREENLPCAVLNTFENESICQNAQRRLVDNGTATPFCINKKFNED